jgi:glycosyltransferase involved in cell wall biosynthesis
MTSPQLSIVSPVYRAERLVTPLVEEIIRVVSTMGITFEIILVEDGSQDRSWASVVEVTKRYSQVVGIKLSRNFGQHYAISAGLAQARGEWVVVMDCDLQDRPDQISALWQKAQEGFDVVLARRALRQDHAVKRLGSHFFYRILGYLTGSPQDPAIANFGIYHRRVVDSINSMSETIRYFPTMVRWVGFHSTAIDVSHAARPEGKTSYNWRKLLNLAIDICLAYSDKPLRLAVKLGFLISAGSFSYAAYMLFRAFRGQIEVLGYASLIVSIWFLSGLIIFILGIVGLYVGKSFEGVKSRPAFIIQEKIESQQRT